MVRLRILVGHPGDNPVPEEIVLSHVPRVGEYIRVTTPDEATTVSEPEFWKVIAVVHERVDARADVTVYVEASDEGEILTIFDELDASQDSEPRNP